MIEVGKDLTRMWLMLSVVSACGAIWIPAEVWLNTDAFGLRTAPGIWPVD